MQKIEQQGSNKDAPVKVEPVRIQKVGCNGNTYAVKTEPPQTQNVDAVKSAPPQTQNVDAVKSAPPQTQNVEQPSDPNMGSILIPDEHAEITNIFCSFCGMGIEMTDELLNDLICAQQKNVMDLMRKRINAHFAERRSHQSVVGVQCQLVGKPIQWNKPTE